MNLFGLLPKPEKRTVPKDPRFRVSQRHSGARKFFFEFFVINPLRGRKAECQNPPEALYKLVSEYLFRA